MFRVLCLVDWVGKVPVWYSVRTSLQLDCEFRYILGCLQIQIPSLEFEIIKSIWVHLWLYLINGILAGVDSNRSKHSTVYRDKYDYFRVIIIENIGTYFFYEHINNPEADSTYGMNTYLNFFIKYIIYTICWIRLWVVDVSIEEICTNNFNDDHPKIVILVYGSCTITPLDHSWLLTEV